jgi:hypothetical protein
MVNIFRLQKGMAVNYFSNTNVNFTHENVSVVDMQRAFVINGELGQKKYT